MKLTIRISLKKVILDPQGEAIFNSLKALGFEKVNSVRQGKILEIEINETDQEIGKKIADKMCQKLLVNNVIETYSVEVD